MSTKEIYQYLYESVPKYGRPIDNHCPGITFYPHYQSWIKAPVMDLGCGTGDTVMFLRNKGIPADGMDQINFNPQMRVGDICDTISDMNQYSTGLCIDVMEHIDEAKIRGLLSNLAACERQIITIHNKPAAYKGPNGEELHINLKPFGEWKSLLEEYFVIEEEKILSHAQNLYLCRKR